MTKSDLIVHIAQRAILTKDKAGIVVNAIFEQMIDALNKDERIEIRNFGTFTMRKYPSYTGRNPKTGKAVAVAAKRVPFFKVGLELKNRVDSKR